MIASVVAVGVGAALGALLRWALGTHLNTLVPLMPMGTLTANLLGGYLAGVALALFTTHPALPPEIRLFAVTGFLGGLTTFSTFSAEVVAQLMTGRPAWALATVAAHVLGSLGMTLAGVWTVRLLQTGSAG